MKRQSSIVFIFCIKLLVALVVLSTSASSKADIEDWPGLYLPEDMYKNKRVVYPDFQHFFTPEHDYILITNWKNKLILQSRISTQKPLRFGYFDSEIKNPYKNKQIIVEDNCNVELTLDKNKLIVEMKSASDCNTRINLSGVYIKFNTFKEKNEEEDLFLGKFNNEDLCDKATQTQWNNLDLAWSTDKDLKEFVEEAKKRNLNCNVKKSFTSIVLGCIWGMPKEPQYCEQLKDIRGPYQSEKLCKKRAYEIAKEMPKYRPHMEPRGYLCEEN